MQPALSRSGSSQNPMRRKNSFKPGSKEPAVWRVLGVSDNFLKIGISASAAGHFIVFLTLALGSVLGPGRIEPQVIYSVTLEGGKTLGGMTQAPKKEKSQLAPPKKIQEPKKATPKKEEVKKKVEPKKEEVKVAPKKEEKKVEPKKPPPTKKVESKTTQAKESQADIDKRLQQAVQRYTGESTAAGGTGFGAGRLGGEGMGGGVQRPPEFFTYKSILEDFIKSGWRWYDPAAKLQAQVGFDLGPDGKITNIILSASSGIGEYDDSVLRAVSKADPVPAPPESVYEFFKKVRITFVPGD